MHVTSMRHMSSMPLSYTPHFKYKCIVYYTIDMKKFVGLNIHGFNATEVFTAIFSRFLGQKCLLLKRGTYIYGKTFEVLLKTTKTTKVYPSESFSVNGSA